MTEKIPIAIIGGGVIGCAIAYTLSTSLDEDIFLIERNNKIIADNQSSRNSGVIHAGIYHTSPFKSKLCVAGNTLLYEFCKKHNIPHKKTGALIVATDPMEEEYLEDTLRIALQNSVPGVKKITGEEAMDMEPNITAISALYAPSCGIIEPTSLVNKLHHLAEDNGATFVPGNKVTEIIPKDNSFHVTTVSGEYTNTFETKILINAAGIYSDDIARMINPNLKFKIIPLRGESAKFYNTKRANLHMNGMNIYPVPCGIWPNGNKAHINLTSFKSLLSDGSISKTVGLHLTPTFKMEGNDYTIGNTTTIGPAQVGGIGKEEYNHSRDIEYYFNQVNRFFPNLQLQDIELHHSGIQARLNHGDDFIIYRDKKYPNCINLLGIDSPGLTATFSIAGYVQQLLKCL